MSPSVHGKTEQQKRALRVRACIVTIQKAGQELKLPQMVIATAATFFHRFFACNPLHEHDRLVMVMACLFLASKVEEVPKKARDVILATHYVARKEVLHADSAEFARFREDVIRHERLLVTNISLAVDHPYHYLVSLAKAVDPVNKDLIQISWNFVNDSLRTEVCLNYDPRLIAGAALYLSVKCLGFNITRNGAPATLFEVINMPKALIEEVSSQILDLYETAPSLASMRGDGSGSGASTGSTHMPAEDGVPQ